MPCPPPPIQRNHKGWRSAPDAILPGHRRHPSGSRQGHPRYTGAVTTGGRGWPDTNDTNVKSRCNDASSKHSKTPVLRQTFCGEKKRGKKVKWVQGFGKKRKKVPAPPPKKRKEKKSTKNLCQNRPFFRMGRGGGGEKCVQNQKSLLPVATRVKWTATLAGTCSQGNGKAKSAKKDHPGQFGRDLRDLVRGASGQCQGQRAPPRGRWLHGFFERHVCKQRPQQAKDWCATFNLHRTLWHRE